MGRGRGLLRLRGLGLNRLGDLRLDEPRGRGRIGRTGVSTPGAAFVSKRDEGDMEDPLGSRFFGLRLRGSPGNAGALGGSVVCGVRKPGRVRNGLFGGVEADSQLATGRIRFHTPRPTNRRHQSGAAQRLAERADRILRGSAEWQRSDRIVGDQIHRRAHAAQPPRQLARLLDPIVDIAKQHIFEGHLTPRRAEVLARRGKQRIDRHLFRRRDELVAERVGRRVEEIARVYGLLACASCGSGRGGRSSRS